MATVETVILDVKTTQAIYNIKKLDVNIKALSGTTKKTISNISKLSTSLKSVVSAAGSAALSIGAVVGGVVVSDFITVNTELERMQVLLDGVTGSTQAGAVAFEEMLAMSEQVPFSVDDLASAFTRLTVSGVDDVSNKMQVLADSVAAFGGTSQDLDYAALAIQQMASKGVVSLEELRRQLAERIPTAVQDMATGLGLTYEELISKISSGSLRAQGAINAMFEVLSSKYAGRGADLMNTFGGAMSRLRTEYTKLLLELSQKGAWDSLIDAVKTATKALESFRQSGAAVELAERLGDAIGKVVQWVEDNPDILANFFDFSTATLIKAIELSTTFFEKTTSFIESIPGWMLKVGIVGAVLYGVGANIELVALTSVAVGIARVTEETKELNKQKDIFEKGDQSLEFDVKLSTAQSEADLEKLRREIVTMLKGDDEMDYQGLYDYLDHVKETYEGTTFTDTIKTFLSGGTNSLIERIESTQAQIDRLLAALDAVDNAISMIRGEGSTITVPVVAVEEDTGFDSEYFTFDGELDPVVLPAPEVDEKAMARAKKAYEKELESFNKLIEDFKKETQDINDEIATLDMTDYEKITYESSRSLEDFTKKVKESSLSLEDQAKYIKAGTEALAESEAASKKLLVAKSLLTAEEKLEEAQHNSLRESMTEVEKVYDDVAQAVEAYKKAINYDSLVQAGQADEAKEKVEAFTKALIEGKKASGDFSDAGKNDWEKQREAILKTNDALEGFKVGIKDLQKDMTTLAEVGLEAFEAINDGVSDSISTVAKSMIYGLDELKDEAEDTYNDAIGDAYKTMSDSLADLEEELADGTKTYEEYAEERLSIEETYNDAIVTAREEYTEDIKEAEEQLAEDIKDIWYDVLDKIIEKAADWAADMVIKIGANLVEELLSGDVWGKLSDFWEGLSDTITSLMSGDWSSIGSGLSSIWDSLTGKSCVTICDGGLTEASDKLSDAANDISTSSNAMGEAAAAVSTSMTLSYDSSKDTVLAPAAEQASIDVAISDGSWNAVEKKWEAAADTVAASWSATLSNTNYDWSTASVKASTEYNQMLNGTYDMANSTFDATKNVNQSINNAADTISEDADSWWGSFTKSDFGRAFSAASGAYSIYSGVNAISEGNYVGGTLATATGASAIYTAGIDKFWDASESLTTAANAISTVGGAYSMYTGISDMLENGITVNNVAATGLGAYSAYSGISGLMGAETTSIMAGVSNAIESGWNAATSYFTSEMTSAGAELGAVAGEQITSTVATDFSSSIGGLTVETNMASAGAETAGLSSLGSLAQGTFWAGFATTAYTIASGILDDDDVETRLTPSEIMQEDAYTAGNRMMGVDVSITDANTQAQAKLQETITNLNQWSDGLGTTYQNLVMQLEPTVASVDSFIESISGMDVSFEDAAVSLELAKDAANMDELYNQLQGLGLSADDAAMSAVGLTSALSTTTDANLTLQQAQSLTSASTATYTQQVQAAAASITTGTASFSAYMSAVDSTTNTVTNSVGALNEFNGSMSSVASSVSSAVGSIMGSIGGLSNIDMGVVSLGSYATGTDYVPETGPYILHRGEAVIPADENGESSGTVVPEINVQVFIGDEQLKDNFRVVADELIVDRNNSYVNPTERAVY